MLKGHQSVCQRAPMEFLLHLSTPARVPTRVSAPAVKVRHALRPSPFLQGVLFSSEKFLPRILLRCLFPFLKSPAAGLVPVVLMILTTCWSRPPTGPNPLLLVRVALVLLPFWQSRVWSCLIALSQVSSILAGSRQAWSHPFSPRSSLFLSSFPALVPLSGLSSGACMCNALGAPFLDIAFLV